MPTSKKFIWSFLDGTRKMEVNAKTGFRKETRVVMQIIR